MDNKYGHVDNKYENDSNNGLSMTAPKKTINAALGAGGAGKKVIVSRAHKRQVLMCHALYNIMWQMIVKI